MNRMEYEMQQGRNHRVQSLGKIKHTQSQGIETKSGKNKKGTEENSSRTQLAQRKSFDCIQEHDYREFTTSHPSSYPLKMIL